MSVASWTAISLPITAISFGAVGIGWTSASIFALRCHDGIVDASFQELAYGTEMFSYIAFCK